MDFPEDIQGEIAKAAEGLTRVAEELYRVNRNDRYVRDTEEHKKQYEKQIHYTTQALAYSYRLYQYIQRTNSFSPSEFIQMSEDAQKISETL